MQTIKTMDYTIYIGHGILKQLGTMLPEVLAPSKIALVTDATVGALYAETLTATLSSAGYTVFTYTFPAGETSKTMKTVLSMVQFFASHGLTRTDFVIALGGGVTGDMAGFAASMYLRGVPFIQVPTTVLAAVDSSVGGKTGANLPEGKNLIGAFYRPKAVYCDLDTFGTLPPHILADGMAEVIKYGMIGDADLFAYLQNGNTPNEEIVAACVRQKCAICEEDEFDRGKRQYLNFGHTFGHAIEKCSQFTISHGSAVAIGMVMAAKSVEFKDTPLLIRLLKKYNLPTTCPFDAESLFLASSMDKKRDGADFHVILPQKIGQCKIESMSGADFYKLLERGLKICE